MVHGLRCQQPKLAAEHLVLPERLDEGACALLKEDDVGVAIFRLLRQDPDNVPLLVHNERVAELHLQLVPVDSSAWRGRSAGVHDVHQDSIEDALRQHLQGQRHGLLLLRHCRVLGTLDWLQQVVNLFRRYLALLVLHRDICFEHEVEPLREPCLEIRHLLLVVVDDSWPAQDAAICIVDGVGKSVRHGGQPLGADVLVLEEARDDSPLGEVLGPHEPDLVHP
mmetsp:Transcript_29452/g.73967  ORF Transcript_29452/g.73967 Transcript_29452/m.73967 type:complete len:223 (+) Transcript_29452:702-1370(+)